MRSEQSQPSADSFELAHNIRPASPEALVSLAHASFALGRYAQTAHYLGLAVRRLPELAAANIRLRSFFRSSAQFIQLKQVLERQAEQTPDDASVQLCLAYIQWCEGNITVATTALRQAAIVSKEPALTEVVQLFWAGCRASGKTDDKSMPMLAPAGIQGDRSENLKEPSSVHTSKSEK